MSEQLDFKDGDIVRLSTARARSGVVLEMNSYRLRELRKRMNGEPFEITTDGNKLGVVALILMMAPWSIDVKVNNELMGDTILVHLK